MTSSNKTVIVDLDGTLSDCRHRVHHVQGSNRDWKTFFGGIAHDPVVWPIADMVRALSDKYKIVLCTGRPEDYRAVTETWLDEKAIPYDVLYMRPFNDTRPDHVIKMQLLEGIKRDGYDPVLVIDDRQSVVDAWREAGLVCLQAAPGEELQYPDGALLTIMVGPSGAGKSTWLHSGCAQRHFGITESQILSTVVLRAEACGGDFRRQDKNDQVFKALRDIAKARLKNGFPVVLDATHLKRKDRLANINMFPTSLHVRYIVINRDMAIKKEQGGWRNEIVRDDQPFDLIGRHEQTFNSNLPDILKGDNLPNVIVHDLRGKI